VRLSDDAVLSTAPPSRSNSVSGPPSGKIRVGAAVGMGPPSGKMRAEMSPPAPPKPRPSVSGPPSGKIKMGTGLAAALAGATATPASPVPSSLKPPSLHGGRLSPLPLSPTPAGTSPGDFDVELVNPPGPVIGPADLVESSKIGPTPMRPLYDLDRRDFIMLAIGAGGVLGAIGFGLAMAKLNRNKIRGVPIGGDGE
jgi:eukaryotic-like serine/threonine-protein kinase